MNRDSKDKIHVILPKQPQKGQGMIDMSILTVMRAERVNNG
jgi:hypothetical protein